MGVLTQTSVRTKMKHFAHSVHTKGLLSLFVSPIHSSWTWRWHNLQYRISRTLYFLEMKQYQLFCDFPAVETVEGSKRDLFNLFPLGVDVDTRIGSRRTRFGCVGKQRFGNLNGPAI